MEELNNAELNTILAALQLYQSQKAFEKKKQQKWLHDIATDMGKDYLLTSEGIDQLCEKLNCRNHSERRLRPPIEDDDTPLYEPDVDFGGEG